ncbi:MAG: pseudouridine synthase [Bacillus subtilis]|nr:pseudouridine synthase [Bacillus subtilis]
MRINVFISSKGICSRRAADRLVSEGRVMINGLPALTGMDVAPSDNVTLDGRIISDRPLAVYLAYHKPLGIESTTDQTKRHNIIDAVGYPERIFPIGRLDKDSSGLILLTNDGQIVNRILRSENAHEKEYLVTLDRSYDQTFWKPWRRASKSSTRFTMKKRRRSQRTLKPIDARTFSITLIQGLNLQIRRMAKALGYNVLALKRVRIMSIHLGKLAVGQYRILTAVEVDLLFRQLSDDSAALLK